MIKNIALVTKGIQHCFWGPCVGNHEIVSTLNQLGIGYQSLSRENCNRKIAADLADGYVVGIFRGASEFGPRALGARSIIADPRNPHAQDRVNLVIKQREKFRPFAPVVLNEYKHDYFDCDFESPYMTEVCPVKKMRTCLLLHILMAPHVFKQLTFMTGITPLLNFLSHFMI